MEVISEIERPWLQFGSLAKGQSFRFSYGLNSVAGEEIYIKTSERWYKPVVGPGRFTTSNFTAVQTA